MRSKPSFSVDSNLRWEAQSIDVPCRLLGVGGLIKEKISRWRLPPPTP
jgi:hypothetical protein